MIDFAVPSNAFDRQNSKPTYISHFTYIQKNNTYKITSNIDDTKTIFFPPQKNFAITIIK